MSDVHLHDPQTLYRHWEEQQWSLFAIALERDREQWPRMSGEDRGLVHWALSSLMVAEERITTEFAEHVARAREQLSPAFATVFDEGLVRAHERLVANPGDPAAKGALVPRGPGAAARVRGGLRPHPP